MAYPIKPGLVVKPITSTTRGIALPFANRVPIHSGGSKNFHVDDHRVDVAHKASISNIMITSFEVDNLHWFPVKINPGHTSGKQPYTGSFESLAGFLFGPNRVWRSGILPLPKESSVAPPC